MGSGQGGSANTSEILTNDGNSRPSFPLKANIMYDDNQDFLKLYFSFFRLACPIELDDHVIVTGGAGQGGGLKRVDVYTLAGWSGELPPLITGRRGHGCGHYVDTDGNEVNYFQEIIINMIPGFSGLSCNRRTRNKQFYTSFIH